MKTDSHPTRSQPALGDLFDLSRQLQRDAEATGASLRHRDRAIGQQLGALEGRPTAQLLGWLDRVREQDPELRGDRVSTLHRLGLLILAVAGLLSGWGAAAVIFRYDGTHPVNVIHVIVVFVLLQLVSLLFFGLGLLPPAVTRWLPGMRTLQETLGLLSPGRIQRFMARWLPQEYRETAAALLGRGIAHQRLYGSVDRWLITHSSQSFAVFFNLGALASALYLVAFSDLAFSWSTTLQLEPADLKRWTDLLSAPWAAFFADGRPSAELIASTRYFRLQEGSFPASVSPEGLGGWWPFLVTSMAVYGLLPRLLTWLLALRQLRRALRRTFRHLPGSGDLLARLNSELVETRAEEPEWGPDEAEGAAAAEPAAGVTGGVASVIDWAVAAGDPEAGRTWLADPAGVTAASWHAAGGVQAPEQDREVIAAVAAEDGDRDVVVLVKGWEPPMSEFLDFVGELRAASSPRRPLLVAPLGRDGDGAPTAAEAAHLAVWRRSIARQGDPWLKVLQLGGRS